MEGVRRTENGMALCKSVGVVSTARVTHATPGALYAKTCHRDYETDTPPDVVTDYAEVKDIAAQLVDDNHDIQVVLGGGRANFFPNDTTSGTQATRTDGQDLVQKWRETQAGKGAKAAYVENKDELKSINLSELDYLLGLFNPSHMAYEVDRLDSGPSSEPSISDMLTAALQVLGKNPKGFFLLVEGGRIDHGHHMNLPHKALRETIAMDQAIGQALQLTSPDDTLVMVTADHSHTMAISGYPDRDQDILGTFTQNGTSAPDDGLPLTVLQYTNGPGPQRINLTGVDTTDKDFVFPNGIGMHYESHGGEDVAVFARGPMAHLVGAVQEQNVLAHIMGFAACMGPNPSHCNGDTESQFCPPEKPVETTTTTDGNGCSSGRFTGSSSFILFEMAVVIFVLLSRFRFGDVL